MPIKIHRDLPAYSALTKENVFVMTDERAAAQDIRPLKVAIANLMPTTVDTETQLLRLLGNTPLQIDITFLRMGTHDARHAPPGHLEKFYLETSDAMNEKFDGLIVTGAPVETLPFPEVDYWNELTRVFEWSTHNVFSTLHICWGAQAALFHHYGIEKHTLPTKMSGIFPHTILEEHHPLFRGFDDVFFAPQSRHTASDEAAIVREKRLTILARSDISGPFIISEHKCRRIFVTGHLEYDALTLDKEYRRDKERGLEPAIPQNYYENDDPARGVFVTWRSSAHLFFRNWLNMVYQETPYNLESLS